MLVGGGRRRCLSFVSTHPSDHVFCPVSAEFGAVATEFGLMLAKQGLESARLGATAARSCAAAAPPLGATSSSPSAGRPAALEATSFLPLARRSNTFRGSPCAFQGAPRAVQDTLRFCQGLHGRSGSCQGLPRASKGFHKPPRVSKGLPRPCKDFQGLPTPCKAFQHFPRAPNHFHGRPEALQQASRGWMAQDGRTCPHRHRWAKLQATPDVRGVAACHEPSHIARHDAWDHQDRVVWRAAAGWRREAGPQAAGDRR